MSNDYFQPQDGCDQLRRQVKCTSCKRIFRGVRELSQHSIEDDCEQAGEVYY